MTGPSGKGARTGGADEGVRLAKRVAELVPCSRSEAEQYIEGGWVRVDGQVVDVPQFRVTTQRVEMDAGASLAPIQPVTLLLHKPPGYEAEDGRKPAIALLTDANRMANDRSGVRAIRRHFMQQACVTPLETGASGLVVFTQDWPVKRKLVEDAARVEHELIADVKGEVTEDALRHLNRAPVVDGRAMLPAKVSVSRDSAGVTGLRFAMKGAWPGQIAQMCDDVGLEVVAMKRLRVGRVGLGGLEPGQWRYLLAHERF